MVSNICRYRPSTNPSDSGAGFKIYKPLHIAEQASSAPFFEVKKLQETRGKHHRASASCQQLSHLRQPWSGVDLGHCAAAFAVHGFGAGHGLWGQEWA
jgi:hypothetical protein